MSRVCWNCLRRPATMCSYVSCFAPPIQAAPKTEHLCGTIRNYPELCGTMYRIISLTRFFSLPHAAHDLTYHFREPLVKLCDTCTAYFCARVFPFNHYPQRPYNFRENRQAELSGTFLPFALFCRRTCPAFRGTAANKFPHTKRFKALHSDTVFVHKCTYFVHKPSLFVHKRTHPARNISTSTFFPPGHEEHGLFDI